MTDFLGALAARAFPQRDALQPRLATRFEIPRADEVPLGVLEPLAAPLSEPPAPATEPRREDPADTLTSRLDALDRLVRTLPRATHHVPQQQIANTEQPVTVQPSEVRVEHHHHDRETVERDHAETERVLETRRVDEHHHHDTIERREQIERIESSGVASPVSGDRVVPAAPAVQPPATSGRHATAPRMTHERVIERETPGERIVERHTTTRERDHETTLVPGERIISEQSGTHVVERVTDRAHALTPNTPPPSARILERLAPAELSTPEPEPPSIHVSIGRIEIRATNASEPRPRAVTPRPSTLDDYLRRRDRGRR